MDRVRVFAVGDADYFIGIVALVNSLRITGNDMPVTLLDLGFTPAQRTVLASHCELADAPRDRHPHLTKMIAPMRSEVDVVILLDADVLVTGSLEPLIADAQAGLISAPGDPAIDRFHREWPEIFGLRAPIRHQPYVNAGVVALSRLHFPNLLERWSETCARVADRPTLDDVPSSDPVWLPDQDALNALLMSEVPSGSLAVRSDMMTGQDLHDSRFTDLSRLACERDGRPVRFLHMLGSPKPWQQRARWEFRSNTFVTGLRRALSGSDLEIVVPPAELAVWLRNGWAGAAARGLLTAYDVLASWSRPLRRKLGLSPWRKRDGYQPGRS